MNLKCDFPFEIAGKHLAANSLEAISLGLTPELLPPKPPQHIAVYLSKDQAEIILSLAKKLELKPAELVERMAYALHQHRRRGQQNPDTNGTLSESDRNRAYLLKEIISGIDSEQIVIAEASTGLGKSRVLGQAAAHILTGKRSVVWVAAPTIAVLLHLIEEFAKADKALAPAILLGRQQFVSVGRVRALVNELAKDGDVDLPSFQPAVEAWLDAGAPTRSTHTRKLAAVAPGISHLMDDLIEIAPKIRPALVAMREKDNDEPAQAILDRLNDDAAKARLVFCTHTMMMLRSKHIAKDDPLPFTHLLVDEVHELEAAAADLESNELSLFHLRSWLRQQGFAHSEVAQKAIGTLMRELSSNERLDDGYALSNEALENIRRALKPVVEMVARARKGDEQERREFVEVMRAILNDRKDRVGITFSPVRRYPSLFSGPVTVAPLLGNLWKRVKAAVGVSGTIYLPTFSGGLSSGYMVAKLSVPRGRVRTVGPIVSSWILQAPTLMRPADDCVARLCYPSKVVDGTPDEDADETEAGRRLQPYTDWLDSAAIAIAHASDQASGGMLVLCTSFRDALGLRTRLALSLGERLIVQDRGIPVQQQKSAFIEARRRGLRPVWLATGAAWTGLDLRDQNAASPEEDTLMTDLGVLRAPLGLNRSSTHWSRRNALGFSVELFEASIRLRQGIGRLIRSEGLIARKLWIFDGRLYSPIHRHLRPLATVLNSYQNQKCFSLA